MSLGQLMTVDALVAEFGEQYRSLIISACGWLDTCEPLWKITLDRKKFIAGLIERIAKDPNA
jgi:hypothetical protein